jgi:hypothetical protein
LRGFDDWERQPDVDGAINVPACLRGAERPWRHRVLGVAGTRVCLPAYMPALIRYLALATDVWWCNLVAAPGQPAPGPAVGDRPAAGARCRPARLVRQLEGGGRPPCGPSGPGPRGVLDRELLRGPPRSQGDARRGGLHRHWRRRPAGAAAGASSGGAEVEETEGGKARVAIGPPPGTLRDRVVGSGKCLGRRRIR